MRFTREEYIDLHLFKDIKRQMFVELFGTLIGLDEEWKIQGASKAELEMTGFDWDYVPYIQCGGNTDIFGGMQPKIIEETNEYVISMDELGRRMKLIKGFATIPIPLDNPIVDMDSWLKVKPLYEFNESRINIKQLERAQYEQKNGVLVVANIPGGFDLPRQLLGEEQLCYAYFEQPELIKDILDTAADTSYKVLDRVSDKVIIDQLSVHEDMAGKSGPMIGPNLVEEFMKPYYLKTWNLLKEKGTKIFSQDSDGNMNPIMDELIDCGLTEMYPLEPGSSMDIVEIRKKYGNKLTLKGGINKYLIKEGKEVIRKELEYKMQPLMQKGGVIFGLDHRIPNGTPLEYYRYYVKLGRELLGIEPLDNKKKGWLRQAF